MNLIAKKKYSDILKELISIKKDLKMNADKTEGIKDAVENMPLLVPVVGEFSAGKSTLLNTLIGKDILGVSIQPETAIPAELYYSETEFDEGVKSDGTSEVITDIENAPKKYSYLRRHINSQFLKEIQPIVLVDMPGFDSPLDAHNKAIVSYLERGIHYAMLIPSDAGTITKSMQRQVQNIMAFNKECTFFMSKTDLRSQEELEQVREELTAELSFLTGHDVSVEGINCEDVSQFGSFVNSMNPEILFKRQFSEAIIDECNTLMENIKTRIAALKNDKEKNSQAIKEFNAAIDKIEAKKEEMIARAKKTSFFDEATEIADAVGSDLNAEIDSLVEAAKSGGDVFSNKINSIMQSTIFSKVQDSIGKVSVKYCDEFSEELKDLNEFLESNFGSSEEIMGKVKNIAEDLHDSAKTAIDGWIAKRNNKLLPTSASYKAITGLVAALTNIAAPIVEAIIIMLPEILNKVYEVYMHLQQDKKIRKEILSQIPGIKRQVREKVTLLLKENSEDNIKAISEKYDEKLQEKREEIKEASEENERNSDQINAQINKCGQYLDRIGVLISEVNA